MLEYIIHFRRNYLHSGFCNHFEGMMYCASLILALNLLAELEMAPNYCLLLQEN